MWNPITIEELTNEILSGEINMTDDQRNFWDLIKIKPTKWTEDEYGTEGGGFWVVAIFGNEVIWYNDIEEGFNISKYDNFGSIMNYQCSQSELNWVVIGLMERITANRYD
jgi:hypothetical protein